MSTPPKAPPVYKPAPQRVAAPPAYQPSAANNLRVQLKPANNFRLETRPAPPVYRPAENGHQGVQPKVGNRLALETRPAPPVYQPHSGPTRTGQQTISSFVSRPATQLQHPPVVKAPLPQRFPNIQPTSKPRTAPARPPLPSRVLQRMEGHTPEVEMRSQFFTEGAPVDLNCGRYCTEAAMKWWGQQLNLEKLGDVFHQLLPEPVAKGPFGTLKIGWAPWLEGKDLTVPLGKPKNLQGWASAVHQYGPLIVSGNLGEVSSKLGFYVGHFILIVDVDVSNGKLVCKDPLKGNETISYDFDWIDKRIQTVNAVHPGALQAAWEKQLKVVHEEETQRSIDAVLKLSPNNFQNDDSWDGIL